MTRGAPSRGQLLLAAALTALCVLVVLAGVQAPAEAASGSASPAVTTDPPCGPGGTGTPVDRACPQVLVVGVAGLRWDDLGPQTPVLLRLSERAALGALSVKALPALTCRGDGWLTLGAGARAGYHGRQEPVCGSDLPADLDRQRESNARSRDGAVLGALAAALDGGVSADGDGARVAVGTQVASGQGDVRVLDAGTLPTGDGRPQRLADVDAELGRIFAALPAETDLLVVGVSEGDGATEEHLHPALATGPSFPRGALVSASTQRAPYVQLVDVAPTVLDLRGRPVPASMDGQPWRVVGTAPSVADLVDLDRRARAQREATVPFFVVAYGAVLLALLLALWRGRRDLAELVALTGTGLLGASYLAGLVPWWRAGVPLLALLAVVVPVAALGGLLARTLGRARSGGGPARPAALVCAAVAGVLLVDLASGATLQIDTVAGYSPLVAGRFAGIGNVAFGVLAASVLLATAGLARRPIVLLGVAVLAVVLVGAPGLGSDVGGVLSLVPALTLLVLLRTGRRVSFGRLALAGAGGAVVVTAFALVDLTRPATDRTHLGRFAADVADGTAGELLRRKADAVLDLLFDNAVTALLPVLVAALVYLVARPPAALRRAFEAVPGWRHGLLALGPACLVGFAINDSGAAVPALAACVAIPATLAVLLRTDPPGASYSSAPPPL